METFPDRHENLEDFLETLKSAFLYAKTVTLGTSWLDQSLGHGLRRASGRVGLKGLRSDLGLQPV